jgi:hypothetical protein
VTQSRNRRYNPEKRCNKNSSCKIRLYTLAYTKAVGCRLKPLVLPQDEDDAKVARSLFGTMDSETDLSLKVSKSYREAIWSPWEVEQI